MFKDGEAAFAAATEQTVQRDAFGELLARTTENVMALTKIAFDVADVIVRSLRLAGRRDIDRLGRQLARTEDKLELVLQEIEALRAENSGSRSPPATP
jgi:hypothetical protein